MKLFSARKLRRNGLAGVFARKRTALKFRAGQLLRQATAREEHLSERVQKPSNRFKAPVSSHKLRGSMMEAIDNEVAAAHHTQTGYSAPESKRISVSFNRIFSVVFRSFLKSGSCCAKNRKTVHKTRLEVSVRLMCFFPEAIGMFCFREKHRTNSEFFRRRIQPKERFQSGYRFEYFNRPFPSSRYPLISLRSHFGHPPALNAHFRRSFVSFQQNPRNLCGIRSLMNGRMFAFLHVKVARSALLTLFVGSLCFGVSATLASENNAKKPSQKIEKAKKGASVSSASRSTGSINPSTTPVGNSSTLPVPPFVHAGALPASPTRTPAGTSDPSQPSVEPKEIKKLKSYCKRHPNDWEGFYNLGIEQYKLMDYAAAQQSFAQALQNCSDPKEQEKIFYNLGNAGFRFSQSQSVDQQVLGFKESLQNYENALAIDKEAKDTQHNIEVVKRYLKRAEKQQQQNQQKKKDDKKDDNKNLTNMEKDKDSSDNKDKDKDKDDPNKQKDQQGNPDDKNVDLEQKEMDNILNRAKKVEKMLPPSSLDPKSGGKDPVIRDW